jgi:hypothetical protein
MKRVEVSKANPLTVKANAVLYTRYILRDDGTEEYVYYLLNPFERLLDRIKDGWNEWIQRKEEDDEKANDSNDTIP